MAAARRLPQPAQAARPSRNRRPGSPGHQLNGPSAGRHRAHPPPRSPVTAQDASESCKTPPPGLPGESTHRGPTRPILTRAPRDEEDATYTVDDEEVVNGPRIVRNLLGSLVQNVGSPTDADLPGATFRSVRRALDLHPLDAVRHGDE